ncbi:hypothetical protein Nepgr_005879 [Nepenthes gracilis]|uniref:phosphatidate phosphatase n=1 Tax=Nepenthes gracilis TaxID=150966 RepID=A0AAD3S4B5_NEPGR|nr:hypothetical protein Nepgr_005879 [Nepenthes gracilis]
MYAVGRLSTYITRGVHTVSGPFHTLGGAVDIIVVEQQDGSFKSSPWYVRFGNHQGVLKANEKIVSINVNGAESEFHMYLDPKGEAYFLREVDGEEAVPETYPSSSGDEEDEKSNVRTPEKSKSCNFCANGKDLLSHRERSNAKTLALTTSSRATFFGLLFGKRSMKTNGFQGGESAAEMGRASSLERAEIAADLLEVKWSTNLASSRRWKDNASTVFDHKLSAHELDGKVETNGGRSHRCSFVNDVRECKDNASRVVLYGSIISETGRKSDTVPSFMYCDTEESLGFDASSEQISEALNFASLSGELHVIAQDFHKSMTGISEVNSESPSSITVMDKNLENVEHMDCCISSEELKCSKHEQNSIDSTGNSTISKTVEAETATELDISHQFKMNDRPVKGNYLVKEVVKEVFSNQELDLNSSSCLLESCRTVLGSNNEVSFVDPFTTSSSLNLLHPVSEKEVCTDGMGGQSSSLNAEECGRDDLQRKTVHEASSISSGEDLFAFSDPNFSKLQMVEYMLSASSDTVGNVYHPCDFAKSNEEAVNESTSQHIESLPFPEMFIQEDELTGHSIQAEKLERKSSPIGVPNVHKVADQESLTQIMESVPSMQSHVYDFSSNGLPHPMSHSLHSNFDNSDAETAQLSAVNESQIVEEIKKIVSDPAVELSLCRHLLYEGMGYEVASVAFDAEKLDDKLGSLGPDLIKNERLVVRIGGLYFPWDAALPIASAIGSSKSEQILEPKGMIVVDRVEKAQEMVPHKSTDSKNGSWRLWPFSVQISKSMKRRKSDMENPSESHTRMVRNTDSNMLKFRGKKMRATSPTSEQLASLNLKEGKNVVTFTISTAMTGEQQVDARIYLWKPNTKIVISDVDGTITKSDVLGQFMPLVGIDWSQTGVAHLYSAIKENGYQLLFLSARAISQAYHTRQFLLNLTQDGKALPEGPVLISPDGIFPSLYREVIRRAPHEFKIACLEDIKALFPPDCNPFYAGFGNRDTDEISYLHVGIPKGKIFIINPKGKIAVNHRVDTKSYHSLHAVVNDMFPSTSSNEQEDFNSWNYWKLPPPCIDI